MEYFQYLFFGYKKKNPRPKAHWKKTVLQEGDVFRTIIPLKKISTQKVGGTYDPLNDSLNKIDIKEFIKGKVRSNNKITRNNLAQQAGVSVSTIERAVKEIKCLKYVGHGKNGHWEIDEEN